MEITRRDVLGGLTSLTAATLPGLSLAQTLTMGAMQIDSVSDGNLVLPGAFFFDGLPQDEVGQILSANNLSATQLTPPCNLTLLRRPGEVVLFDAGSGAGFMPSAGTLIDSLEGLGVAAEDVTHVIFTHAHPDHLWGVLDDFDDPVFPQAAHMIGRAEWAYWTDPNTVDAIGEARASFAVGAARRLEAVAPMMTFFDDGAEVLPGVAAVATPGHTPGHMSFEVRDGTEAVLIGGDAIGNHHIAFARPEWPSGADQDADLGAATRQRLLDKLATEQIHLMGFHLPQGGLGRVERSADAYRFVPAGL